VKNCKRLNLIRKIINENILRVIHGVLIPGQTDRLTVGNKITFECVLEQVKFWIEA
jgi:hypothetical protein